ncbi:putative ER lumen protein-retaining receptor [Tanacetum coccineum]|uniref:ER lumen protein-retaining receptor n=1 Tax=Tanacetum coccineum TaxID=301880 RepID=A0ABQ5FIT9_9ASTR
MMSHPPSTIFISVSDRGFNRKRDYGIACYLRLLTFGDPSDQNEEYWMLLACFGSALYGLSLKSQDGHFLSYMHEKDNVPNYYIVIPCALLSLVVHPTTQHHIVNRILWAFCVYLEAVSVLPQLRVMQSTKIVEPFTAHYVFALGVARFLSCAHWILQDDAQEAMQAKLPTSGTLECRLDFVENGVVYIQYY